MSDQNTYGRRSGPRDRQLRVGNAERETVVEILRREHLAGRLDHDEFDARVARCLAAKTYAELDELIRDFPADEREARRMVGRRGPRPWPLRGCRSAGARRSSMRSRRIDDDLDRFALVHRAVAVGYAIDRLSRGALEDTEAEEGHRDAVVERHGRCRCHQAC